MRGINKTKKQYQRDTGINIEYEIDHLLGQLHSMGEETYKLEDYIEYLERNHDKS